MKKNDEVKGDYLSAKIWCVIIINIKQY